MRQSNHHILNFLINRELSELYATMAIKGFALSLIGIFIPIFLLERGFSITEVGSFYIIQSAFMIIFSLFAAKFIERYGVKHSIFASIPLLILFYYLLDGVNVGDKLFYVLPLITALSSSFFWIAFHIDFSKFSRNKHRGEELGFLESLLVFLGMLAPFLGGLILTFYNFKILFMITIILIIISVIPLLFSKEVHEIKKFSFRDMVKMRRNKMFSVFFVSGFTDMAASLLWPIFIFKIVYSFVSLGALISIGDVFLGVFLLLVGRLTDTGRRNRIFKSGIFLRSISLGTRIFAKKAFHIALFNILAGISYAMIEIPFMSRVYDKATKTNITNLFVLREFVINLGRIALISVFLMTGSFVIAFMISGVLIWVYLLFK